MSTMPTVVVYWGSVQYRLSLSVISDDTIHSLGMLHTKEVSFLVKQGWQTWLKMKRFVTQEGQLSTDILVPADSLIFHIRDLDTCFIQIYDTDKSKLHFRVPTAAMDLATLEHISHLHCNRQKNHTNESSLTHWRQLVDVIQKEWQNYYLKDSGAAAEKHECVYMWGLCTQ